MYSRKLALAAAVVACLAGLAPASASARKHPGRGRCVVNINVAPQRITAGDSVVVFGRLRCRHRPAEAGGQAVKLFQHIYGTPGFVPVQSTTTDASGFYELNTAAIETNSVFYVRSHGAASGRRRVRVEAQVTFTGPPEGTQLLTGQANKVTFSGTVSPADVGARVILQRQNAVTGDAWHRIDVGIVQASGAYSITHTFIVPGDANLRVLVRSQGRNIPSVSNILTYEISQAQNPNLTIFASADPIAFGQTVTITGTLAGGAHVPVTLLAHTDRQRFAPVAQVMTDGSGNYSFPGQSPVNSTFYMVQSNPSSCVPTAKKACPAVRALRGVRSAVLYEGVQDVLTAQVSASSVQAGQTLTFSGTVAPDHTGHVIYLERKNATGDDFHVVQVARVGPGSAYSIVHKVYVPGTKIFRVRIPGGPENEGAVSQPFTILVTPAPAALLTPEAPENGALNIEAEA